MYWSTERGCRQSGQIPVCRKRLCSVLKEQPVPTDKVRHNVAATFKWPTPSSTGFSLCSCVSSCLCRGGARPALLGYPCLCSGRLPRCALCTPNGFTGRAPFLQEWPTFRSAATLTRESASSTPSSYCSIPSDCCSRPQRQVRRPSTHLSWRCPLPARPSNSARLRPSLLLLNYHSSSKSYLPLRRISPVPGPLASPSQQPRSNWTNSRRFPIPASSGSPRSKCPSGHYPTPVPSADFRGTPPCERPANCAECPSPDGPASPSAVVRSAPPSSMPAPLDPVGELARRTTSICLLPAVPSWKADNSSPAAYSSRRPHPSARSSQTSRPASTALHPICCTAGSGSPAAPIVPPSPAGRPSRSSSRRCGIAPPPEPLAPLAAAVAHSAPAGLSDTSAEKSETLLPPVLRGCCRGPPWPFRC